MRGSFRLLLGDVRDQLRELDRHSVHCCVTSPPYLGLRDYGVAGQIGLEASWQEHLQVLLEVFREVHRVLRPDGTLWVNYGDAYAQKGRHATEEDHAANAARAEAKGYGTSANARVIQFGWDRAAGTATGGLKPKDLMGMPWRLALALQEAGWWLRADNIWSKPNPTPEPPRGRPTVSHEYVFLLAKAERYYYDGEAVRVPHDHKKPPCGVSREGYDRAARMDGVGKAPLVMKDRNYHPGGRNLWTVWNFPTQAFPARDECDHFATFPEELPRICIAAGTSEKGCCPACGAPWKRVLEKAFVGDCSKNAGNRAASDLGQGNRPALPFKDNPATTVGWEPTCVCGAGDPIPCTVLDPFAGSGTTGVVALRLGRSFVGVELNPAYHALATRRLDTALLPVPKRSKPRAEATLPLFADDFERSST